MESGIASNLSPTAPTGKGISLPSAISASRQDFNSARGGRIHYYADRAASGRPLLLIHSVNAAPSAFEMKPLFDRYRAQRPVFALDLPGFGHSDRSKRRYSPELFAETIAEFLEQVIGETADLVAFSLGCEFAARAAIMKPQLVSSLVMLSPTGFNARSMPTGEAAVRAHKFLSVPGLSDGLFSLLTTRPSIRFFYRQAFGRAAPADMVEYAHATAHQPGAKHAPLYFLSGQLFTPNAGRVLYNQVTQPVLILYDKDPNIDFHELPDFLGRHSNWRAERIAPTHGIPQWEQPALTGEAIDRFWSSQQQAA